MTVASVSSVTALLLPVWLARREIICDRIKSVRLTLEQGPESATDSAMVSAHQLRGSLGTFGFASGSTLLGEVEQLLKSGDASAAQCSELAERLRVLEAELAAAG